MTSTTNDRVHQTSEAKLLLVPSLKRLNPVGTFNNEDVRTDGWNFSFDEMAVLFTRVVASVEDFDAGHVYQVHAGAKDMAGVVWSESDSGARCDELVSRDRDDRRDRHGKVKRGYECIR